MFKANISIPNPSKLANTSIILRIIEIDFIVFDGFEGDF